MDKTINMYKLEQYAEGLKDLVKLVSRMNRYKASEYDDSIRELRNMFFSCMGDVLADGYVTRLRGYWVTGMYTHKKMRVYDIVEYIPIKD